MSGPELIKIGSISITKQALVIAVSSIVASLIIIAIGMLSSNPVTRIASPFTSLVILAGGLYAAYSANCAIVGNCEELAWFMMALYIINGLLYAPFLFYSQSKVNVSVNALPSPKK